MTLDSFGHTEVKKVSSDISFKIPGSQLPLKRQPTNILLTSNQVFQLRSMEPKLSKSSTQTKILLFHFSSHKSLPEVCRSLHYLMKLNLIRLLFAVEIPENIFVGNSDFSLFCSVLATHASPLPDGRPASVKQSACWNRRYESYLSAMQQGGHMENL